MWGSLAGLGELVAKRWNSIEQMVSGQGYLPGEFMASTFNMLRANDLIWFFHINNYLMGKEPPGIPGRPGRLSVIFLSEVNSGACRCKLRTRTGGSQCNRN